jgi:hypothetical protein
MDDKKSFDVFVNAQNPLTDGWSKPLEAKQVRGKLKAMISVKLPVMDVDIPEDILLRFKDMHWCFPNTVVCVENSHTLGQLDGFFEYLEPLDEDDKRYGIWNVKVTWEGVGHKQQITLQEMTTDVPNTLSKFVTCIDMAVAGVKKNPPIEEINARMWDLVPAEGDTH